MPVDTGFIVYNERNYPNLTALFDHFAVPTKASDMSFGVSLDGGRFEYSGSESYGTLFAQKSNLLRPDLPQDARRHHPLQRGGQAFSRRERRLASS